MLMPGIERIETQIDRLDRHSFLFGKKISASLSPYLHAVVYKELGLAWGQIRLDSADIESFLQIIRHPKFYGASVTMPNKVAIMPFLDELTAECRAVGACNTIFVRQDALTGRRIYCGTNTDVIGIRDAFLQNVSKPRSVFYGRPAMVIGGGGAARSAIYALRTWLGATSIYVVNRHKAEVDAVIRHSTMLGFGNGLVHVTSVRQAEKLGGPGAVVACVPNLPPRTEDEKLVRQIIELLLHSQEPKGAFLEMCYNPTPYTELAALAEYAGWQVIMGTEALIYQGLEQDKYWTGREFDELLIKEVKTSIASKVSKQAKL